MSFWIRISSTESDFSSPYGLQKAVPAPASRSAGTAFFLSVYITLCRDEIFLPSVAIACCPTFKIFGFCLITPHVRMELPACVCDRTCSCFSATAESILPTFDTGVVTKKTNSTLPDISLRPHCFREDVCSETPGITRGLRSFYRLVLSNFRRNALYACITPGRNEALCLFCSESFYMSPQGFRSATWSPTIPLRKIAFCLSVPQISAARIAGSVSELRIDKLLSRASRHPTVSQLELVCAPQQLFLRKRYTVALGERQYNLVIGPARRFVVPD